MSDKNGLNRIVGEQLSSVEFIQDYVQLHFDGACLTAITLPAVTVDGVTRRHNDSGYRDALCVCIAKKVIAVKVDEAEIRIDFGSGRSISISLQDKDYRGPEAAVFHDGHKPIVVF
jgi:hypothetical protein